MCSCSTLKYGRIHRQANLSTDIGCGTLRQNQFNHLWTKKHLKPSKVNVWFMEIMYTLWSLCADFVRIYYYVNKASNVIKITVEHLRICMRNGNSHKCTIHNHTFCDHYMNFTANVRHNQFYLHKPITYQLTIIALYVYSI